MENENQKKLGRPTVADKRVHRSVKFSDAEWAKVISRAEKSGRRPCVYVREVALGALK